MYIRINLFPFKLMMLALLPVGFDNLAAAKGATSEKVDIVPFIALRWIHILYCNQLAVQVQNS